jgi:CxxC-x17-CxxC domain-containing protein
VDLQDKTLTCRECNQTFLFTAGEQGFYIERGLMNAPQRCPSCRAHRRGHRGGEPEVTSTVTCARCGREATVPFVPRQDRPVYCADCFSAVKAEGAPVGA